MADINIKIDPKQLAVVKAQLTELNALAEQVEATLARIKAMLGLKDGDE